MFVGMCYRAPTARLKYNAYRETIDMCGYLYHRKAMVLGHNMCVKSFALYRHTFNRAVGAR